MERADHAGDGSGSSSCSIQEASAQQLFSQDELMPLLECSVCLNMLCEPITISCGHTFCRRCLVNSLKRHKKKCPSCRAVCHTSAEDANENSALKSLVVTINPELYKRREEESAAEKMAWDRMLPVFFYSNPEFPGGKLQLHLFEPRYKLMMQRIVNAGRRFAYVPKLNNNVSVPGDLAVVAELKEVEFSEDGRCEIEASLTSRNRIIECFVEEGTGGLHFCKIEELTDEPVKEEDEAQCRQLLKEVSTMRELSFSYIQKFDHFTSTSVLHTLSGS